MSIAQLRARRKRAEPAESIVPIIVIDPKQKLSRFLLASHRKEEEVETPSRGNTQKGKAVVFSYVCGKIISFFVSPDVGLYA